jgi:hypothetical protein
MPEPITSRGTTSTTSRKNERRSGPSVMLTDRLDRTSSGGSRSDPPPAPAS